jgi:acetyl/propionyl-CoA carboxylase alpha subunit/acetyl-CoA carboxylase carboxyltransferase component
VLRDVESALRDLRAANPLLDRTWRPSSARRHQLQKVLVANRGEIAKRFFFALKEEGIPSVAIVTDPDRTQSWYEFADEVVYIGAAQNYTALPVILAAVRLSRANAVYPGYGFLSEDPRLAEALYELGRTDGREIIFLGPSAEVMRRVGSKLETRGLAKRHVIPLLEGTERLRDLEHARAEAARLGYPLMLMLSAGGGGKGMAAVFTEAALDQAWESTRRLGRASYGDDAVYLEKYIQRPVHIEVQIFNGLAVGLRKCAVQRRNQKIIEETGDFFLTSQAVLKLLAAAENVAEVSGYGDGCGAGTVEFLWDDATEEFDFLEIKARLQVEYPVTDQSLRVDLAKWQILYFDGREAEIPYGQTLRLRFGEKDHAIECRIYAEDPWNNYAPSAGVIQDLDLPTFNGIRCDFGFKKGDTILPDYDPMIGKVIARGTSRQECLLRLERALGELYVRGITTNVDQLLKIVRHPEFRSGTYTNELLGDAAELRSEETDAERPVDAAVFACLGELAHVRDRAVDAGLATGDLEGILRRGVPLPSAFRAQVHGKRLQVQLLQLGLERYVAFVNGAHFGEMQISRRVAGSNDYSIVFRGRSYPVRIDRRPSFDALRIMEEDGRIHYYRVTAQAAGHGPRPDPPGAVRAPFQGSFVKFASDQAGEMIRIGSRVGQRDPLIVIEAMKMETALAAPVSGVVSYLLEDGELARLVRGTTSQGLIIGRPLREGELLVIVDQEGAAPASEPQPDAVEVDAEEDQVLGSLLDPGLPDGGLGRAARADPATALPRILGVVRSRYLGYVQPEETGMRLAQGLRDLKGSALPIDGCEDQIREIIDIYATLKRLYSPTLESGQTWFGEMNRLVREWDQETYAPPDFFRSAISALLASYGIAWSGGKRTPDLPLALLHILRGYSAIREGRPLIAALLELLLEQHTLSPGLLEALTRLVEQEEAEGDDMLAFHGRACLARAGGPAPAPDGPEKLATATPYRRELENFVRDPLSVLADGHGARERAIAALARPDPDLALETAPPWVRVELERRRELWSRRHRVEALPAFGPGAVVYRLTPLEQGRPGYVSLAWPEQAAPRAETNARGEILTVANLEQALVRAIRLLVAYHGLERGERNVVEVLACGRPVPLDLGTADRTVYGYDTLVGIGDRLLPFLQRVPADYVIVDLEGQRPGFPEAERRILNFSVKHGRPCLDLLDEADRRHPLWNGTVDERNQRLFDRDKWPVELWIREAFDPGTAAEIVIESIDGAAETTTGTARTAVGAKLYLGRMDGRPAVFFLKDSRVSGGATGDLEGRKYVAACYYAYLRDIPLYVWNDGAGANVKQGILALNRAAEGFMMNALVANHVSYAEFLATVRSVDDHVIRALFDELDRTLALPAVAGDRTGPRQFFLVAVGVGSSTGLDVYGSSQASVQVMLDHEQSYRVLTGSSVIRAVTGEELTNYEIGGARVMGQWTGTVDLVARDRIDLLARLRQVHELFWDSETRGPIVRAVGQPLDPVSRDSDDAVLDERRIRANVDAGLFMPFKGEYVDAGALVGGFARLGGKPVLVMGPRTQLGVRSFGSVVRTKELLQIANKTRACKVLVLGPKWYQRLEGEDEMAIQARMDFIRLLFAPGPPRVDIVTHPEGLLLGTMHSHADAVIYARRHEDSEAEHRLALRTATFQADTLGQAFDLANRLLNFLWNGGSLPFAPPRRAPDIPAEPSRPFDMVTDVIEALVDDASFLEFHREGRETAGSTLVTGLATLEGHVIGIIADQPLRGGAPDAPGTEKFRVFMEFSDRHGLPLLMLSNAPGFVPGTKQERLRIQQIGGQSLDVNVLSHVPVVSVVLNQNFGGRQIHAFSRFLRPGVAYIALDRALLGVMGGPAAFDLFHGARYAELTAQGKRRQADKLRNDFLEEFDRKSRADQDALRTGVLDWTVKDPADLRSHVVRAMEVARAKVAAAFGRPGKALEPAGRLAPATE